MRPEVHVYSNVLPFSFLENITHELEIVKLSNDKINDKDFKNKNIFFIIEKNFIHNIEEEFLLHNNVFILLDAEEKDHKYKNCNHTTFFYSPVYIKSISKIIKNNFDKNRNFQDVKVRGDIIINQKTQENCLLTNLEKKIFLQLILKQSLSRDYLLEKILKFSKKTETKTAESHITRIRKKLKKINSTIKISSKSDKFFIEN